MTNQRTEPIKLSAIRMSWDGTQCFAFINTNTTSSQLWGFNQSQLSSVPPSIVPVIGTLLLLLAVKNTTTELTVNFGGLFKTLNDCSRPNMVRCLSTC